MPHFVVRADYREEPHPEDRGAVIRVPDVPASWRYGQLTSALDAGRLPQAVLVVETTARAVRAWKKGNRRRQWDTVPSAYEDAVASIGREVARVKQRTRPDGTTFDVRYPGRRRSSARTERLAIARELATPFETPPPPPIITPSLIIGLIGTIGLAAAMKWVGAEIGPGAVAPLFAAVLGTCAFTAADGTEVNGFSLDTGGDTFQVFRNANGSTAQNGNVEVTAGEAVPVGSRTGVLRVNGTNVADHYSQGIIRSTGNLCGPTTRRSGTAADYYLSYEVSGGSRVYRVSSGSLTQIAAVGAAFTSGDTVRLESVGSDHELFVAGVSELTATDSTHTTGTAGWYMRRVGDGAMDDFEWGDFVGGGGGFFARRYYDQHLAGAI